MAYCEFFFLLYSFFLVSTCFFFFFFFSSRRRHTRWTGDWSSDVCSSDLPGVMSMNDVLKTGLDVLGRKRFILHQPVFVGRALGTAASILPSPPLSADAVRSEERRVGKECRSRWSPEH